MALEFLPVHYKYMIAKLILIMTKNKNKMIYNVSNPNIEFTNM